MGSGAMEVDEKASNTKVTSNTTADPKKSFGTIEE